MTDEIDEEIVQDDPVVNNDEVTEFDEPVVEDEEEIIVQHTGKVIREGYRRFHCPNCKRFIHCRPAFEYGEYGKVVLFRRTCNNAQCECACRTHFVWKGNLYPYGFVVKKESIETGKLVTEGRSEFDKELDAMNKKFKELSKP